MCFFFIVITLISCIIFKLNCWQFLYDTYNIDYNKNKNGVVDFLIHLY